MKHNPVEMFDGTSLLAVWFCSASSPLTRRLLVYFAPGTYIGPPSGYRAIQDHLFANPIWGYADPNDPTNPAKGSPGSVRRAAVADPQPFDPASKFGHMHAGPAEWWIVQSGQVTGR